MGTLNCVQAWMETCTGKEIHHVTDTTADQVTEIKQNFRLPN